MHIVGIEYLLRYHRGKKEAAQMMLACSGILPNTPDKEGQTPLWHALVIVGREYDVFFLFFSWLGSSNNDHSDEFLRSCTEAPCARDGVDRLQPTAFAKAPLGYGSWSGLDSQLG